MTEKRRPHHDLSAFKDAFCVRRVALATRKALRDAAELNLDIRGIEEVVSTMQRRHFVKSMTSYEDIRSWQDAYHVPSEVGLLYVKFTDDQICEFRLLSFKEK